MRSAEEFPGQLGYPWSAVFPVAKPRNDTWILVCGGIATAAAFAAAFLAAGGVASHPAPARVTITVPGPPLPALLGHARPAPASTP